MIYSRVLIAAFLLLLAACTTSPLGSRVDLGFREPLEHAAFDPCFRFGLGILSGFDSPCPDITWEPHDWMLLGVKVTRGEQTDVWFVRLTTLPEPRDERGRRRPAPVRTYVTPVGMGDVKRGTKYRVPTGRVLIKVHDREGKLLNTSVRLVPHSCPGQSILEACQSAIGDGVDSWTSNLGASHDLSGGFVGVTGILSPISLSRAVTPLREIIRNDIIKRPSVIGLLLGGLRLDMDANLSSGSMVRTPWHSDAAIMPRCQIEFPIGVGGQTMLECRAVVGPNQPPYHLTGGVLQFEAAHPDKPHNRMMVQVLAAKRLGN